MSRAPRPLGDAPSLIRELQTHPSLRSLRASPDWPALEPRLSSLLSTVRRYEPEAPPAPASDRTRVMAVHWNVEHGNWYEQVERALIDHPQLRGADVLLFNEIDLGMARAANRDVTADLAAALGLHAIWAPLFLETTTGRDDDPRMAGTLANQESLFGLAILSRWPIGDVQVLDLPSPMEIQFDLERMYGRHIALLAEIRRPGGPFVAVSVHLEVHRTRADRARQMQVLMEALRSETRPVLLAGDFNSHTFDRGRWWDPLFGAAVLLGSPTAMVRRRLLYPDRGAGRERLFDALREANFEWNRFVDRAPTLQLRFDRLDEARGLVQVFGPLWRAILGSAERRANLRLDWFAGRGWREGRGCTIRDLNGPGKASDHAPIVGFFQS